jgi:hypothetical protein
MKQKTMAVIIRFDGDFIHKRNKPADASSILLVHPK